MKAKGCDEEKRERKAEKKGRDTSDTTEETGPLPCADENAGTSDRLKKKTRAGEGRAESRKDEEKEETAGGRKRRVATEEPERAREREKAREEQSSEKKKSRRT